MNKPAFSVIIPTYNRAELLGRTLRSLVAQIYKNFEVIVCDDGSTDHTKEVVASFNNDLNIKYVWEENWGGPARPRNNGIKAASSEWICFLDHDDWWYPNKLDFVVEHTHHADIIYHDLDVYSEKGKRLRKVKGRRLCKPVFVDLMCRGNALLTSSVVVRKSLVQQVDGFTEDEKIVNVEDNDLWLKLSKINAKFFYIPRSLGGYWEGGGNTSVSPEVYKKKCEMYCAVYKRHVDCLTGIDKQRAEMKLSYDLGRSKQKIGEFDNAITYYKVSAKSRYLGIKFKSIYLLRIRNIL
jgi:glycosyltransferase involved in cell wall biosynthesis